MQNRTSMIAVIAAAVTVFVLAPIALLGVVLLSVLGDGPDCSGAGGAGGGQQQIGGRQWSAEQMANAQTITGVTQQRQLPRRAAVLAVSTAIVEAELDNVDHGDRDSLGLFQQRPSMGWGTAEQVTNPVYATHAFLDRLVALEGWARMPAGEAQQAVQASAFPQRYAPQEEPAADLVGKFWSGPDHPVPAGARQVSYTDNISCTDQGGGGVDAPEQKGLPADFALPADPRQRAAVSYAIDQLGKPYVFGAKGPDAFDCSGLMQAAWAHAGAPISAGTLTQISDGTAVASPHQLQPGDLVFIPGSLGTPAKPRHVGLYVGHGVVINAYDTDTGVVVHQLDEWAGEIAAIRRIAEPTVAAPPPHLGSPQH